MGIYLGTGICLPTGSAIIFFVVKSVLETLVFMRAAARAVGTVVRLDTTQNSDGQTMYLPVFEYRTRDGTIYQHTSSVASRPPSYEVGATATLLYLKKNPRNAKIKSFAELWLAKIIPAAFGAAFLAAAFFFFRAGK